MKKYLGLLLLAVALAGCSGHLVCGIGADAQVDCKDRHLGLSTGLNGNYDAKMEKVEPKY